MTRVITEDKKGRPKWLLLLPVLALAVAAMAIAVAASANSHPAMNTFNVTGDALGADDVPGQKDLTMQGTNNSDEANGNLWVVWAWDETSVSGNNTLDACTLFDTDADGNANEALCLTLQRSGNTLSIKTTTLYSCGDARNDRCSSTITSVNLQGSFCEIETNQTGQFGGQDTQAFCDIKVTNLGLSSATNLLNTCSYPSSQPNSDPSDCVLIPGAVSTSVATSPSGSATWSVTLNDSATMTPSTATGTVTFTLYAPTDTTCTTPIYTASANLSGGSASTSGVTGSPSGGNTVSTAGTYHWKATYGGANGFNGSDSGCGEAQTVTAAGVS
jgi:hypothetical protein